MLRFKEKEPREVEVMRIGMLNPKLLKVLSEMLKENISMQATIDSQRHVLQTGDEKRKVLETDHIVIDRFGWTIMDENTFKRYYKPLR